jgi:hypothetical protein
MPSTGGDSGLSAEQAWLSDPDVWEPVPGTEFTKPMCEVFEAVGSKIAFPTLVWGACGTGCEVTDLVQGYGTVGALPAASTHALGPKTHAFLTFDVGPKTSSTTFNVRRVVRLEDGVTVAAIQTRISSLSTVLTCVLGNGRESARANVLVGGEPSMQLTALAPLGGGKWTWSQPAKLASALPGGLVSFDIDSNGGAVFLTGQGTVAALLDPSKNDWTTIEDPSTSGVGTGQGDLAIWTDYPTLQPERIRGWAPDGSGVRTLIDPAPSETCDIAVSPTSIVGFALEGGKCHSLPGAPTARFWKSPRAYDQAGVNVTLQQELPGGPFQLAAVVPVRTWGDYAGAMLWEFNEAGTTTRAYLAISQLSSGKLWRLDADVGHQLHPDAWTLTPTHLFLGDQEANDSPFAVRRMLRIDLAALDQAATPLN